MTVTLKINIFFLKIYINLPYASKNNQQKENLRHEILGLGSNNNLAQHRICCIFFPQNHSTLLYISKNTMPRYNCKTFVVVVVDIFIQFKLIKNSRNIFSSSPYTVQNTIRTVNIRSHIKCVPFCVIADIDA